MCGFVDCLFACLLVCLSASVCIYMFFLCFCYYTFIILQYKYAFACWVSETGRAIGRASASFGCIEADLEVFLAQPDRTGQMNREFGADSRARPIREQG